jgi:hypothetical protein
LVGGGGGFFRVKTPLPKKKLTNIMCQYIFQALRRLYSSSTQRIKNSIFLACTSNMVNHVLLSTIEDVLYIFVLATIPVYIMIIITIAKNRKDEVLKHAFFDLMISVGVADLGRIFCTISGSTLPRKGWVPQFYIWLGSDLSVRLSFAGLFSFGRAQLFGVFVVALNRFTAYALPMRHNRVSL